MWKEREREQLPMGTVCDTVYTHTEEAPAPLATHALMTTGRPPGARARAPAAELRTTTGVVCTRVEKSV